jgi:hypothetical protein
MTTEPDAVIVHDLTHEALADALISARLLKPGMNAVAESSSFWEWAFEGRTPRTAEEAQEFADNLLDRFVGYREIGSDGEAAVERIRPVVERFVDPEHVDGIIAAAWDEWRPDPDTDLEAWKARWRAENPEKVRRERIFWWSYAVVAVAAVGVGVLLAILSGQLEAIVVAAVGGPGLALLIAGIAGAVFRGARGQPDEETGSPVIDAPS